MGIGLEWSMMQPYEVAVNLDIIDNCFCFFLIISEYVTGVVPVFISYFSASIY